MRLLAVGDLHIKSNNFMLAILFPKLERILKRGNFDCCVLLGDIFHNHEKSKEEDMNTAHNLFEMILKYCKLYIIVGNHDFRDKTQFMTNRHTLLPFSKWEGITVIDKATIVKEKGIVMTMVPFVPKGRFMEALNTCKNWKSSDLIFCHQEFKGCNYNGQVSENGDVWNEKYPQIISGHIHEKQNMKCGVFYPGTPYDTSFGYNGKRIVSTVNFKKNGTFVISSIETKCPRMRTVQMDLEDAKKYMPDNEDFIKLIVSCSDEEFDAFTKTDHARNLKKICNVRIEKLTTQKNTQIQKLLKSKGVANSQPYRKTFQMLVSNLKRKDVFKLYENIFSS